MTIIIKRVPSIGVNLIFLGDVFMSVILDPLFYVLTCLMNIYFIVVVFQVALHWLIHFNILAADNKYSQKLVEVLNALTEPVYAKIRSKIPPLAGFDVSPFILLIFLLFLNRVGVKILDSLNGF